MFYPSLFLESEYPKQIDSLEFYIISSKSHSTYGHNQQKILYIAVLRPDGTDF